MSINMEGYESIKHCLGYFDPQILEIYKSEPNKYEILFDEFEGELRTKESYFYELERNGSTDNYIYVRFGRITLQDGEPSLIVWLPNLRERSSYHLKRWLGCWNKDPKILLSDQNFIKWYTHNIEALVVKNGPLYEFKEAVKNINQFTNKSIGKSVYQHEPDLSIPYPNTENTHKYQDSHQDLYRYLLDGLNKSCIEDIALKLNINIQPGNKTTLNALLKIFPQLESSKFKDAMDKVSEQRRLASHKVRKPAEKFNAFEQFRSDLIECNEGLKELLQLLRSSL